MAGRNIIIIGIALILATASAGYGQDQPKADKTSSAKLEDLEPAWERAHMRFGYSTAETLSLKRQVEDADQQLAPIRDKIARLEAQPAGLVRDRELTAAYQELKAADVRLGLNKKKGDLAHAEQVERDAWQSALDAGWAYVPRLYEMYGRIMDTGRTEQARPLWDRADAVLQELSKLEHHFPPAALPPPLQKPAKPENEQARRSLIRILRSQADEYEDTALKLANRKARLRDESGRLARVIERGYDTDGRVQKMHDTIESRIKDLTQREEALRDLAKTYRQWATEFENESPR